MRTFEIGGVKVQYESIEDLGEAVKSAIGAIEARMKKAAEELKKLRRQRRALKTFLGGREAGGHPHARKTEGAAA